MFGEILDALAKPIREGALSSLRNGASGGMVAQLEEIVGKFDALRGTRAQPSSTAPASASATETARPKRTPLAYELEIERMCAGDVRERAVRRDEAARSETSEPPPKGEPPRCETGSIPFERPDPGLVALLEGIDRLDTFGFLRRPPVRSKVASVAKSEPKPSPVEPTATTNSNQSACTDAFPCPGHEPTERSGSLRSGSRRERSRNGRRRFVRARMLRRRRALALSRCLQRPAKFHAHNLVTPIARVWRTAVARGPPS